MRDVYIKSLNELTGSVSTLGNQIAYTLDQTWLALSTLDIDLANKIVAGDDEIDMMVRECMRKDLNIGVMESPVGSDWRNLMSSFKILTDLERIADHCADISHYIGHLSNANEVVPLPTGMKAMYDVMVAMVNDAMDCYMNNDINEAALIQDKDDIVDTAFNQIVSQLASKMITDSRHVNEYIAYVLITKYIERMADHAANIARWVVYKKNNEIKL